MTGRNQSVTLCSMSSRSLLVQAAGVAAVLAFVFVGTCGILFMGMVMAK